MFAGKHVGVLRVAWCAAGLKASMASTKRWEQGSLKLGGITEAIDFAQAQAITRVGILGKMPPASVPLAAREATRLASPELTHPQATP